MIVKGYGKSDRGLGVFEDVTELELAIVFGTTPDYISEKFNDAEQHKFIRYINLRNQAKGGFE